MAFSLRKNAKELLNAADSGDGLAHLHGTRAICCLFLMTIHRFATFFPGPIRNSDYMENVTSPKIDDASSDDVFYRNTTGSKCGKGRCFTGT